MRVLVIGSGAGTHSVVWKLLQSKRELEIICVPGNGGISELAECLDIEETDIDRLVELAIVRNINLVVVNSSKAIALGAVDRFKREGLNVFGPTKAASEIEWSKFFAKEFMFRHKIPTPQYASFNNKVLALAYAQTIKTPAVIKANGLTEDRAGINIVKSNEEASQVIETLFKQKLFEKKEHRVIMEEFSEGEEISVLTICDGSFAVSMLPAHDYPYINDDDEVTAGGMGAFAPTPLVDTQMMEQIRYKIINPTVNGLRMEGRPYSGVIAFDILITKEGEAKLLEFNTSFGDPESQVILPLFDEDLFEVCMASAKEDLSKFQNGFHKFPGSALAITLASSGFPDNSSAGKLIDLSQIDEKENFIGGQPANVEQVLRAKPFIFHGDTKRLGSEYVTGGGKELCATAVAESLVDAQVLAYKVADKISFEGKFYRKDIGDKGLV